MVPFQDVAQLFRLGEAVFDDQYFFAGYDAFSLTAFHGYAPALIITVPVNESSPTAGQCRRRIFRQAFQHGNDLVRRKLVRRRPSLDGFPGHAVND